MIRLSICYLCLCLFSYGCSSLASIKTTNHEESQKEILLAIENGSLFLKENQNKDGSWGSASQTKGLNIFAPVPGSHGAFRLAVTALASSALIECKKDDKSYNECLEKAKQYILEKLPALRRATGMALYNVWAHAYGIQALHRIHGITFSEIERAQITELIRHQVSMLEKYESIDGGWGYYDFRAQTKQPSGSSISFVNATALVALKEAENSGVKVSRKLVNRAVDAIGRQQLPDHSYLYGEYLKYRPRRGINRPAGSLGRSHACNYALQIWGEAINQDIHKICLDRLINRNGWLEIARKRPVPHESWFAVAGYFFYYGHLYASFCVETLPQPEKNYYRKKLASILLPLQEKDGSWWDFPFYNYHQQYGTSMALLSLKRCQNLPVAN